MKRSTFLLSIPLAGAILFLCNKSTEAQTSNTCYVYANYSIPKGKNLSLEIYKNNGSQIGAYGYSMSGTGYANVTFIWTGVPRGGWYYLGIRNYTTGITRYSPSFYISPSTSSTSTPTCWG
jgi:hypothetical protein